MCGRYVSPEVAEAERNLTVDLLHWRKYERSYNVAPTEAVPVVRLLSGQSEGLTMRWGLVPYFCKGIPPKYGTINATIERLKTGPAWRNPWARGQRCLMPASGFYEWHLQSDGTKQPFYVHLSDREMFCFAGLWDSSWREDGTQILSCAMITMPANELMRDIHNTGSNPYRMPAILAPQDHDVWLSGDAPAAKAALTQYPADLMVAWPVSKRVNGPRLKDEGLIAPMVADAPVDTADD